MGWLDIKLDIATAMLSSIAIGVGVDYTIHFFWRYKHEMLQGKTPREAVMNTLTSTGRGITINALSVVLGFSVLFISSFLTIKYFAYLIDHLLHYRVSVRRTGTHSRHQHSVQAKISGEKGKYKT